MYVNCWGEEVFKCQFCNRNVQPERLSKRRENCCKMCSLLIHYAVEFTEEFSHADKPVLDKYYRPVQINANTFEKFLKDVKNWRGKLSDVLLKKILAEAEYDKVEIIEHAPVLMFLSDFLSTEGQKVAATD